MNRRYRSLEDRIIANSVLSDTEHYEGTPCWLWIGTSVTNRNGRRYGTINVRISRGRNKGRSKKWFVHRLVITVFKGRAMSIRQVGMHLCNNTLCCNPAHLAGGSQRANVRQCVREGRHRNAYSEAA